MNVPSAFLSTLQNRASRLTPQPWEKARKSLTVAAIRRFMVVSKTMEKVRALDAAQLQGVFAESVELVSLAPHSGGRLRFPKFEQAIL